MFVLMSSRSSSKLGHVVSKTRSPGQISRKLCYNHFELWSECLPWSVLDQALKVLCCSGERYRAIMALLLLMIWSAGGKWSLAFINLLYSIPQFPFIAPLAPPLPPTPAPPSHHFHSPSEDYYQRIQLLYLVEIKKNVNTSVKLDIVWFLLYLILIICK